MKTYSECLLEARTEINKEYSEKAHLESFQKDSSKLAAKKYAEAAVLQDRENIFNNEHKLTVLKLDNGSEHPRAGIYKRGLQKLPLPELK